MDLQNNEKMKLDICCCQDCSSIFTLATMASFLSKLIAIRWLDCLQMKSGIPREQVYFYNLKRDMSMYEYTNSRSINVHL